MMRRFQPRKSDDAGRPCGVGGDVTMSPPDAVALVVEYLRAQEHLEGVTVATGRPDNVSAEAPLLLVETIEELPSSRMPWARVHRTKVGLQAWAGPELG